MKYILLIFIVVLTACNDKEPSRSNVELISTVYIVDPGLSDCINSAAESNKWEYVSEVTNLNCAGKSIVNIDGIERFKNILTLDLSHNFISDLSNLKVLSLLTELFVNENQISSIKFLKSLQNIEILDISHGSCGNYISDLSPVSALTSLRIFNASGVCAINVNGVLDLPRLEEVDLSSNDLLDINVISDTSPISKLYIQNNYVLSNIRFIEKLRNLKELDISSNAISDISALGNSRSLIKLILADNDVGDLSILANMTNLKVVQLHGNPISEISPLSVSAGLEEFYAQNTNIDSIDTLLNLYYLKKVYLPVYLTDKSVVTCADLEGLRTHLTSIGAIFSIGDEAC